MTHTPTSGPPWSHCLRNESGAALVEFAIVLPLLLILFASIVEGGRMMWSYQATVAGVRDAARYLARVAPLDICSSGVAVSSYSTTLLDIVRDAQGGSGIFPAGITVNAVTPSLTCVTTESLRITPSPVVQVTAELTVTFPFAAIFSAFGGSDLGTLNTTISDQHKVFGT